MRYTNAELGYKQQETYDEKCARLQAALNSLPEEQRTNIDGMAADLITRIKERHPWAQMSYNGAIELLAEIGMIMLPEPKANHA